MRNRTHAGGSSENAVASPAPSADLKRRRFLLALGAGGAGAAATVTAAVPGIAATPATDQAVAQDGTTYRETEHVRDYYRTARI